uniref:Uncharacterized protein n=1 Tax=Cacopsylla melanoneura TaxID=428564 RepID=A0A8D8R8N0_9HEMI
MGNTKNTRRIPTTTKNSYLHQNWPLYVSTHSLKWSFLVYDFFSFGTLLKLTIDLYRFLSGILFWYTQIFALFRKGCIASVYYYLLLLILSHNFIHRICPSGWWMTFSSCSFSRVPIPLYVLSVV